MTENPFWDLIQRYMDDPRHRYAPKAADIARECDLSAQLLSKWKAKPTLPEPEQLARLSGGTGINYPRLLEAALEGKGYFIAGPARVVTAGFLDPAEEADIAAEVVEMPWARPLSLDERPGAKAARTGKSRGRAQRAEQDRDAEEGGF